MKAPVELREIPLFSSLPEDDLASLAKEMHILETGPGEMLFHEGDYGDRLLIILDGELEIVQSRGTADERRLGRFGAGQFLGEVSLLEVEGRRTASVRSLTPARLLVLTRHDFDALMLRAPSSAIQVLRILSSRLRNADQAAIRDLHEKNLQLAQAYEELQSAQAQLVEKERLERELQVARRIQESMLPDSMPELPGFDFGALICPARAVGGDLYDVFLLDETHAAVMIGDVSDKGVPAALFMAQARSLVRAVASLDRTPVEVVDRLNRLLLGMNAMGLFITLIYGVVDREARTFTFTRAGHELPMLFDPSCPSASIPPGKGRLLGVFPDIRLEVQTIPLSPGATLFLYTDGAADAIDASGARYGYDRLESTVCASLDRSAQALCDRVLDSIHAYRGETPQFDDITLVAIKAF